MGGANEIFSGTVIKWRAGIPAALPSFHEEHVWYFGGFIKPKHFSVRDDVLLERVVRGDFVNLKTREIKFFGLSFSKVLIGIECACRYS
jgi:hypothetical protein